MTRAHDRPAGDRRALEAIQTLMRGLAHRVRTPLSVVSNELTYLAKVYQTEECRRAMDRCQGISQILKSASLSLDPSVQVEEIPLPDFLRSCLPGSSISAQVAPAGLCLQVNTVEVKEAFLRIKDVLTEAASDLPADWRVVLEQENHRLLLQLELHTQAVPRATGDMTFSSFASFFCTACGLDLLSAPLVDALLWANQGEVEITYDGNCRVQIDFPLNRAG